MIRSKTLCPALSLATAAAVLCGFAAPLFAAPLAEDHTVLYYLMEMQRQQKKDCAGAPLAPGEEPLSLTPSDSLRQIARQAMEPGRAGVVAEAFGPAGSQVFFATVAGGSPQAAVAELKRDYCPSLMAKNYRYVGAAREKGAWAVILAADEPKHVPGPVPVNGAVPAATGAAAPQEGQASVPPAVPKTPEEGVTPLQAEVAPAPALTPQTPGNASGASAPAAAATPAAPSAVPGSREAGDLFEMVNRARARGQVCGTAEMAPTRPLRLDAALNAEAARHAQDMQRRGYFATTTPEGTRLGKRLTDAGYKWTAAAENLAKAAPPAGDVLETWLASEGQCMNLMLPEYSDAGIVFDSSSDTWVLILAAPAGDEQGIRLE